MRTAPKPPEILTSAADLGDVIVRGLGLRDRLAMFKDRDGDGALLAPELLARCVLDANGWPVYDADGWDAYGAIHFDDALRLFHEACKVCGFEGAEKN